MSLSSLQQIAAEFTPTTAGVYILVLLAGAHYGKIWLESRKLSSADRQAYREGFQKQAFELREENRKLRREHDDYRTMCQLETDQLRDQIVELENRFTGVMRKVATMALAIARGERSENFAELLLTLSEEASGPVFRKVATDDES